MKILFVSYYLPPLLYPQSIQIGRFLNTLKNYEDLDITVLTAQDDSNLDKELYPNIYDGIEVIKVENNFNMYENYIKNRFLSFFYQRPDTFTSWMHKAFKSITTKYMKNNFDIILTFSYPLSTNLLGKNLKEFFDCKWIAHNSDPWIDNPHAHFKSYMRNINEKLEKECFSNSDKLLFTSIETSDFYKNKYPVLKEKIDYINHSFDDSLFTKNTIKNKKVMIRYIGSFYGTRTPKPLFEAINKLNKNDLDKFSIELIGGGKKAKFLLSEYNFNNISVVEPVSYIKSLELMNSSDYLLVIDAPSDDVSMFFPSKLADYIGTNKHILGISPKGSTNRILKELGYKCYNTTDIDGIRKGLLNLIYGKFKECDNKNMIEKYDINFNIEVLSRVINE